MRLIDADVLLEPIEDCEERETCDGCPLRIRDCEDFEKAINAAPTVEAVPVRKGTWIPNPFEPDWDYCTACRQGTKRREHGTDDGHEWVREYGYSFCPNCGAKMEGEKE